MYTDQIFLITTTTMITLIINFLKVNFKHKIEILAIKKKKKNCQYETTDTNDIIR